MTAGIEIVSSLTQAAVQAAINKVVADAGSGVVLTPPGTISVSSTITTHPKVSIIGAGKQSTKFLATGDITIMDIIGTASANAPGGVSNHIASPVFENLQFDGGNNAAWSTKPMVRCYYMHTAEFNSVHFENKYGIGTLVGAECWDCTWRECRWDSCGGVNQGLPSMLIQSADGATFPAFGSSTDATNDQRFYHCTWESFRDGGLWTANPAGANGVGTLFFFGCKADTVATALGPYFKFDTAQGVVIDHMDLSYVVKATAYAGTPFPLIYIRNSRSVDINRIQHNQGGTGEITALVQFDGTTGANNFCRVAGLEPNTTSTSQFTQGIVRFDGSNTWFTLGDNRFKKSNPASGGTIYSGTMPSQTPQPLMSKAGVYADTDFGSQEPGLPGSVAQIAGIDTTNNRLYLRYADGTYHYASLT